MSFLDRLREPSTYASIAAALGIFGLNVEQEMISMLSQAGAALACVAGVFMGEKGKK